MDLEQLRQEAENLRKKIRVGIAVGLWLGGVLQRWLTVHFLISCDGMVL